MRILVVSALYPPVAFGGYEVECSGVVERLRERHDVLVLSSDRDRARAGEDADVRRELASLTPDARGARRAPLAALGAVRAARRALAWGPDLVYVWNGASIPQSALRVLADSDVALAFRVCEHWFGGIFLCDQFMRELLPADRTPARAAWAAGCRALNRLPSLRLQPRAPLRTAISWNSEAIKRMVRVQPFIEPVLERVGHSVPRYGDVYAAVVRQPAPEPEITFLGRVTPYKGVSVAIEALALLRSEHGIAARLVVVGPEDSDHGAGMRGLAERLGVAAAVSWLGPLAPAQVAAQLARTHALIVSSVWDEPFPLVTIEGALARVPLVASDVGGIGEGMHDEQHALLFPRGDARLAAAALARTLREREQTAARVERAYERAQSFRLGPYLDEQERFVADAHAVLSGRSHLTGGRADLAGV
ncbi:MAG: glycosyltransferase family 4 protein [Solirubrobacteraceae bacterium]